MYTSIFEGFFLFTQLIFGVLSLSSSSVSFCSFEGMGPGPIRNADCENEVAPPLVGGLGILLG